MVRVHLAPLFIMNTRDLPDIVGKRALVFVDDTRLYPNVHNMS